MEVNEKRNSQGMSAGHCQDPAMKPNADAFNLIFVNTTEKLVTAWQDEIIKQLPSMPSSPDQSSNARTLTVTTKLGRFQSLLNSSAIECLVSPANSFGLMDGGFDLHISRHYGGVMKLVPVVQAVLVEEWCGEQNVGTCIIVDAHELVERAKQGEECKVVPRYIAHVPTMRVPKVLQPDDDIGYRCTWALLTSVRKHNNLVAKQELQRADEEDSSHKHERINTVLCPGFGTGTGRFPEQECARQMILAVKHFKERVAMFRLEAEKDQQAEAYLATVWVDAEKVEDSVRSSTHEMSTPQAESETSLGGFSGPAER